MESAVVSGPNPLLQGSTPFSGAPTFATDSPELLSLGWRRLAYTANVFFAKIPLIIPPHPTSPHVHHSAAPTLLSRCVMHKGVKSKKGHFLPDPDISIGQ